MTTFASKRILALMLLSIFLSSTAAYSIDVIRAVFPNGDKDVSTAAQLTYQSLYPIVLPANCQVSPTCYDSSGNRIQPKFYIIPTNHLEETDYLNLYAVPCKLFISDSALNLLTIVPLKPLDNGKDYSVVFNDFPVLKPDITSPTGFASEDVNKVFRNAFTTIGHSTHITDFSFDKTGGYVWCKNDKIVVNFNRPIIGNNSLARGFFHITKVGNVINNQNGTVDYERVPVNFNAVLINGGKSVEITPYDLEYGGDYWISTKFSNYLGSNESDNSYNFKVPGDIIVSVDAYAADGTTLPAICKNAHFDGYKRYKMGETGYFDMPDIVTLPVGYNGQQYYLAGWELPGGVYYPNNGYSNIQLKLKFDCDGIFYTQNNKLDYETIRNNGLKIRARYVKNPIDTLELNISTTSNPADCPYWNSGFQVKNSIQKISNNKFTFYRYGKENLIVNYEPYCPISPEFATSYNYSVNYTIPGTYSGYSVTRTNNTDIMLARPYIYDSTRPCFVAELHSDYNPSYTYAPNLYPQTPGKFLMDGSVRFDIPPVEELCQRSTFSVKIAFDGDERAFPQAIRENPGQVIKHLKIDGQASSNLMGNIISKIKVAGANVNSATYEVELQDNSDYEIYLIECNATNKNMVSSNVTVGAYNHTLPENNRYNCNNYKELIGSYIANGTMTAKYRSDGSCFNDIRVHVRRKIVEFHFEAVAEEVPIQSKTKAVPPFESVHMKFQELQPLQISDKNTGYQVYTNMNENFMCNESGEGISSEFNFITMGDYSAYAVCERSATYLRYPPEITRVTNYGPGSKTCDIPVTEKTSVFYYSGESFVAVPYFKENSGYKLKKYTYLYPVGCTRKGTPDSAIVVNNIKWDKKVTLLASEQFRLDYIGVHKQKAATVGIGQKPFNYYRVDDASPDKSYPLWDDKVLTNPDNGVGLLKGFSATEIVLSNSVPQIDFIFNKRLNGYGEDVARHIDIRDLPYSVGSKRADGNNVAAYPLDVDIWGWGNTTYDGEYTIEVTLIDRQNTNVNRGDFHYMCNLQEFQIKIDNSKLDPILSEDNEILSNIGNYRTFRASTVPPGISLQTKSAHNYEYVDKSIFNRVLYWIGTTLPSLTIPPEVIIHSFTVIDKEDKDFFITDLDQVTQDEDGKIAYNISTYKGPEAGEELRRGDSIVWTNYRLLPMFDIGVLFSKQRIMQTYHWADYNEGRQCDILLNGVWDFISLLGKGNLLGNITDIFKGIIAKNGCSSSPSHDEMGYNDFWLVKEFTTYNRKLNLDNEEQDWQLWGVGKFNMYTEQERHSYQMTSEKIEAIPNPPPHGGIIGEYTPYSKKTIYVQDLIPIFGTKVLIQSKNMEGMLP